MITAMLAIAEALVQGLRRRVFDERSMRRGWSSRRMSGAVKAADVPLSYFVTHRANAGLAAEGFALTFSGVDASLDQLRRSGRHW